MNEYPSWWYQAIAIEYLPCRDYRKGNRIGKVDLSLITDTEKQKALEDYRIVSYGTIIHNVDSGTFKSRSPYGLFGGVTLPITENPSDSIPNGLVSKFHFPFLGNPIDVSDPIENFNSHIQVLDNGRLYQWKVADFEGIPGKNYGHWVSDYVDLSEFDEINDSFNELINARHTYKDDLAVYERKAEEYVCWLREIRRKAFSVLLGVHDDFKRKYKDSHKKTVDYAPPPLSHFEVMRVTNGQIETKASMAPICYRSCLKHCSRVLEMLTSSKTTAVGAHFLDEVYEEIMEAFIMTTACLEALVNEIGLSRFESLWAPLEKLSVLDKYRFVYREFGKENQVDTSRSEFQLIQKIIDSRNEIVHFKNDYKKVKVLDGSRSISRLSFLLDHAVIEKIPEALKGIVLKTHEVVGIPSPRWVDEQLGWNILKT